MYDWISMASDLQFSYVSAWQNQVAQGCFRSISVFINSLSSATKKTRRRVWYIIIISYYGK
jgi:hypothetical protein